MNEKLLYSRDISLFTVYWNCGMIVLLQAKKNTLNHVSGTNIVVSPRHRYLYMLHGVIVVILFFYYTIKLLI